MFTDVAAWCKQQAFSSRVVWTWLFGGCGLLGLTEHPRYWIIILCGTGWLSKKQTSVQLTRSKITGPSGGNNSNFTLFKTAGYTF